MTPTHLADEIEALAKKAAGCDPDDHLGRAINHNILVLTMLNNLTAIVSALRERDALKAEVERLRDCEALAKAAARWSHPERRQPHTLVTAEEMLSAIWHHPSRAALGGVG